MDGTYYLIAATSKVGKSALAKLLFIFVDRAS
ncbi:protein of unknown function [Stenotrophomonas maltophilia]|nr:protein of unknown function [Stenotrophomonas maltophilia]